MGVLAAAVLLALACLAWPRAGPARGCAPAATGAGAAAPDPRATTSVGGVGWHEVVPDSRGSAGWARWRGRATGGVPGGSAWVADFAEVVAVGLDAGLDLGSAVVASARSPGVLDRAPWLHARVLASVRGGGGVSSCLDPPDGVTGEDRRDLALLAAAWRLAEEVGAWASDVTAAAADAVRSRHAAHERAVVLAAGPRASMWLLTALPLAGPAAGALVGLTPGRLYGSAAARGAALAGVLLTACGWWWSRRLLARARRPGRTTGAAG